MKDRGNDNREQPQAEQYLTSLEASALLQLREGTLRSYRVKGGFIRYVRLGNGPRGRIRYRLSDIENYLAGKTFTSTSAETVAKCSEEV